MKKKLWKNQWVLSVVAVLMIFFIFWAWATGSFKTKPDGELAELKKEIAELKEERAGEGKVAVTKKADVEKEASDNDKNGDGFADTVPTETVVVSAGAVSDYIPTAPEFARGNDALASKYYPSCDSNVLIDISAYEVQGGPPIDSITHRPGGKNGRHLKKANFYRFSSKVPGRDATVWINRSTTPPAIEGASLFASRPTD